MDVHEKSMEIFLNAWKAGEPRLHLFLFFFDRIPQMTYPLGEICYNESVNKYGQETWWAPHNIWRECVHIIFGAILSLPALGMEHRYWFCIGFYLLFQMKEIFFDLRIDQKWKPNVKNFLDAFCWGMGSAFILLFRSSR